MRSSVKRRRAGRPRASQRRPVLAARVPELFHARILASAAISGRNASEELIWRAEQSYEWEEARGTVQGWLAESRRTIDAAKEVPLEQTLRERGYTYVRGMNGGAWFDPGVYAIQWIAENSMGELLERAATRALQKQKGARS
jgi:hypothetical protein